MFPLLLFVLFVLGVGQAAGLGVHFGQALLLDMPGSAGGCALSLKEAPASTGGATGSC